MNVAHRRAPVVLVAYVPREGHDVPAEAPAAELARKVKARHGERGAGRDLKPAALLHTLVCKKSYTLPPQRPKPPPRGGAREGGRSGNEGGWVGQAQAP